MPDKDPANRSPEVKEIMESQPAWRIKWGISFIALAIAAIVWMLSGIKYREIMNIKVNIRKNSQGYSARGMTFTASVARLKIGQPAAVTCPGHTAGPPRILHGTVRSILPVEHTDAYMIDILFGDSTQTHADGLLRQGEEGQAEILTGRRNILQKILPFL